VQDPRSDAQHARALEAGPQPRRQRLERGWRIAHRRLELPVVDLPAGFVFRRESRRGADPLDLAADVRMPRLAVHAPVDAELQARGARVEDEYDPLISHGEVAYVTTCRVCRRGRAAAAPAARPAEGGPPPAAPPVPLV